MKNSEKILLENNGNALKTNVICFLKYLKFNILETQAKICFTSGKEISVDIESRKVTFPDCVKILKDELILNYKTLGALYFIYSGLQQETIQEFELYFDKRRKKDFEIYYNKTQCINKDVKEINANLSYAIDLLNKNIEDVYLVQIRYSAREKVFCDSSCIIKTNKIINYYSLFCNMSDAPIKERVKNMKRASEFNIKLQTIKQFDFRFGNSFCGIKKLSIFFNDGIILKSNSGKGLDLEPSKEEIINALENFCFINWLQKYDRNTKPCLENAWTIELKLGEEKLEFIGLDDFPKIWPYVEWFVKKYGGFEKIRE